MIRFRSWILFTLLVSISAPLVAQGVDSFFEDFTADWVRGHPELATSSAYFSGQEQDRLNRRLMPLTRSYALERVALAKRGLEQLRKFDRSGMAPARRTSAEVMDWQLQAIVNEAPFLDFGTPSCLPCGRGLPAPFNQFFGANVSLPWTMTNSHPISSARDAENYVARLGEIDDRMEEAVAEAQRLERRGILPPRFILESTIQQMHRFVDPSPKENALVTTLERKTEGLGEIDANARARLLETATNTVIEQVYPAWRKAIAVLEQQLPDATDEAGLSRLERGKAAYANLLRFYTTTDLTAEEIHQIGLREVARIEREMGRLFRRLGRTEGSIAERIAKLRKDRMYPDPTSEASREQVIADVTAIVEDARERALPLFDVLPKSPIEVRPTPTFLESNMSAIYTQPPADGSQPGIFQYPRRLDYMSKLGLRSVTYHEAVPGHHLQLALEVENETLPRFRRTRAFGLIQAFSEGWGLYAEQLAIEQGWYDGDPEGLLDALDSQLFRARRLVVDTGLHAKGWTRQRAIDYGITPAEVDRYVIWPGQACAYMIGQLKIVELREKAKQELGQKFSLKAFHNLVLTMGGVPLEVLESEVDAWIGANKGKD